MTRRGARSAWPLLLGLLLLAAIAVLLHRRGDGPPGGPAPAARWTLRSGALAGTDGIERGIGEGVPPGAYVARGEALLHRGETRIAVSPGTSLELGPGPALPEVHAGSIDIESAGPIRVGLLEAIPLEPSRLRIDPDGVAVARGRVRVGSSVILAGGRLPSGRRAPRSPPPAQEAAGKGALEGAAPGNPRFRAGRIIDASTGAPVGGARVRAAWFHGAGAPARAADDAAADAGSAGEALGLSGAACVPSLHLELSASDETGTFELPALFPEDPRISVHLQVDHDAFEPRTEILSGRESLDGSFEAVEVRLRPALTTPLQVVEAGGAPLAHAPLLVSVRRDGHDFLDGRVEVAWWTGRLVRPDPPRLLFTDGAGGVRLPFSDDAYDLELLHPEGHLYLADSGMELRGRLTVRSPLDGPFRLTAARGWTARHQAIDLDGAPVAGSEIEVALEGMPPLRVRTDAGGWFTIGVLPFPPDEPPLSYSNPRIGTLTALTPELFRRNARVAFPSLEDVVVVQGRLAGRVVLRAVAGDRASPEPLPPAGLDVSTILEVSGLQVVRREPSGVIELRGALPAPGTPIDIHIAGFLPARVLAPAIERASYVMDLGDVFFAPGWSREVVLAGASPAELEGARILVTEEGVPARREARFRVPPSGREAVGGLRRGTFSFSAEGPRLETRSIAVSIIESELSIPLVIPVTPLDEEDVVLRGRVAEIAPLDTARVSVVERWRLAGVPEPISMDPYPLAPDGSFGSVRRLAGVTAVEVSVISPGEHAADGIIIRPEGAPAFTAGDLRLEPRTSAELTFTVEGLGRVSPPLGVALHGEDGLEKLARFRVRGRRLIIDNLHPGTYTLRWSEPGEGDAEGTHAFLVPRTRPRKIQASVPRPARAEEVIELLVVDSSGAPIDGAEIIPSPARPAFQEEPPPVEVEPGLLLAAVRPRETTRFEACAPGFLPARVEVAAGGAIPTKIELYREAAARALCLDSDGERLTGEVAISWESLAPSPVAHGMPVVVGVRDGRLEAGGLPPIPLIFTFRHEGSGLAFRRELTLGQNEGKSEPAKDIGIISFAETRRIRGSVYLADGSPAGGAVAAFVPRGEARRFPLLRDPLESARYSARTSPQGVYEFDALPLDLSSDLALIVHLQGCSLSREEPVDLDAEVHDFVLEPAGGLELDVGYRGGAPGEALGGEPTAALAHGFWLEHISRPLDPDGRLLREETVTLGELDPSRSVGQEFIGIEPGLYRVKWGLRDAYEPLPGLWQDVEVVPGRRDRLSLRVEGRSLRGEATLNRQPVERGWIIITEEGGGGARVGRILDGEFTVIDPPDAFRAYAAVIPERTPQPLQDIGRGEALPLPVRHYRAALREGFLRFDYMGHDLTVRFGDDFMARHPGAVLSFEHYEWERNGFRERFEDEAIEGPAVDLRLLAPGLRRLSVRSAKGTLIFSQAIDLREDREIKVR